MKLKAISLVLFAIALSAFNAKAEDPITELWKYSTTDLNAKWGGASLDWSSVNAIKSETCSRFATASDGKIYTINMKTMSIAEITKDGWRDAYTLPKPQNADDFYGTSISCDRAGNFLVGHYFIDPVKSSTVWSIYNPANNTTETFELDVPDDYSATIDGKTYSGFGRIDCVGRVLGDLTKEAVFFVAPAFGNAAPFVRIVKISHDNSGKLVVDADHSPAIPVAEEISATSIAIAQPKDNSYADFAARTASESGFYMYANSGAGVLRFATFDENGIFDEDAYTDSPLKGKTGASTSGFDSFVIDGTRYFVINYLYAYEDMRSNTMDIAIIREDGTVMGIWQNLDYIQHYGYSSIIAEPLDNGTANIYVYNSCDSPIISAAAMLNFNPANYKEVDPDIPGGDSETTSIVIKTAQDLVNLKSKLVDGDNYITLANDIDMNGISWTVLCPEYSKAKIHLDGCGHVISNLRPVSTPSQNGSLIGYLSGSVKNLGIEDVSVSNAWFCVGAIAGIANDATIENCYVTGTIIGAASGAFVGCNSGSLTISDCYSFADVADQTGSSEYSGGIVGRCDAPLTINNSYASCTVTSLGGHAAGIVSVRKSTSVTLNNVIAWNIAIEGKKVADAVCVDFTPTADNVLVWDQMEVNGVKTTSGTSAADLIKEVKTWDAFNEGKVNKITGYPALNWENKFVSAGIDDITIDADTDTPAEYYNLQGVQVKNPSNGIYIVKRGNTVSKQYIR